MVEIQACPCCSGSRLRSYPALTAAFIADRALDGPRRGVRLLECLDCSFRFFASRFEPAEIQKLYSGYRGPAYYEARHRHEFWYSKKINDSLGDNPAEIASRNATVLEFIGSRVDPSGIASVLDYGGDRGQFIPPQLGKERFVFEISGLKAVDGVTMIPSKEGLSGLSFDLIILANVLEHSSDPGGLLKEIKALARPTGSSFLVTVPYERYRLGFIPTRGPAERLYAKFLDRVAAWPDLGKVLDFYSTLFRVKTGVVPPLGYLTLHEHINFFNETSLAALLKAEGFEVLRCQKVRFGVSGGFENSLLCLARAAP
ncbi:MAG TPA: methyltransferase domain-containing protein [bacterium]|jgi:hypothetical protein|nr:methyltransferase domain-containing protein [bacterium]